MGFAPRFPLTVNPSVTRGLTDQGKGSTCLDLMSRLRERFIMRLVGKAIFGLLYYVFCFLFLSPTQSALLVRDVCTVATIADL